jgi:holo-[acyl-carrier protein] synthase
MIVSTGIDIERIDRVARLVTEHSGELSRIFTPAECAYCDAASGHLRFARYAAAFATKEAVMKALGTGWSSSVDWREIEAKNDLQLHGATALFAESRGIVCVVVSTALAGDMVIASAVAEGAPPQD